MIANFFNKSKPAVIFIIAMILFLYYILAIVVFKVNEISIGFVAEKLAYFGGYFLILLLSNFIIGKNSLTLDNSYALLLIVLLLGAFYESFFEYTFMFSILSLLLGFRKVYSLQSGLRIKMKLFDAGFWIGFATIIYSWSIVYLVMVYLAIIVFKKGTLKNIFVPVVGFAAPIIIYFTYCFAVDQLVIFNNLWVYNYNLNFGNYNQLNLLVPIAFVATLTLWSVFSITPKVTVIGKKMRQNWAIVLIQLLLSLLIMVVSPIKNGAEMFFLVFPVGVIIANFLQQTNSENFKNLIIYLFVAISISVYFL